MPSNEDDKDHSQTNRTRSACMSIASLPLEVIEKIIEYVRFISLIENLDTHGFQAQRKSSLALVPMDKHRQRYIMSLDYRTPLLDSLQSLGAVSRSFHQLCRPLLWKTPKQNLVFPTRLPIPIALWTKNILPREGVWVRSFTCSLKSLTSYEEDPLRQSGRYDNTVARKIGGCRKHTKSCNCLIRELLSLQTVAGLLAQCPNLIVLDLTFPMADSSHDQSPTHDAVALVAFLTRLIPVISRLTNLRHLWLRNLNFSALTNEISTQLFRSLPLLESFSASTLTWNPEHTSKTLDTGLPLSQLKHLSRLYLCRVAFVNRSWFRDPWPRFITDLHLEDCPNINPTIAHDLIPLIAPNLRRLHLQLSSSVGVSPDWCRAHQFDLPALTELNLELYDHNLLPCFQACKNLDRVQCNAIAPSHWKTVRDHLCDSTWPKITHLILYGCSIYESEIHTPENQDAVGHRDQIREFCDHARILIDLRCPILE
ncbi:hypothetical protein CROQUDRAFT_57131 [Cronartium quercuum f. sp. fusiforme G11]|uniref:Uncharacterized protein n=1 Tax=Cronartium quercuum f. sp. fusiforme G11 TaxID=708437 RepID=A0A9P6NX72_9BASI|nr:hypothetical protein CROQUDRAFT_57131 [Cronartium quercuum f. sp. fusiforme G11]